MLRSKSKKHDKQRKAISWFKESAKEHIQNIREIAVILENHGISVSMITTDRPGYIVYEDEYQITAEPFVETVVDFDGSRRSK